MQLKAAREALELETARDDMMKLKDGGVPPRVRPMGLRANHAWKAGGTQWRKAKGQARRTPVPIFHEKDGKLGLGALL